MPPQVYRFSGLDGDQKLRAKVFGIGSAGCSIIENAPMSTVAFSTSPEDLARSHAERKFLIGPDRLAGLSGTEADVLKRLPDIVGHELLDLFNNTDVAFLMCGLGGLTGSLGARMIASIARLRGALGIVLATTPFSAESYRRKELVTKVMAELLDASALVVEFDNDKLSSLGPNLPLSRAFTILNGIMVRPAEDLCAVMSRADLAQFREVVGDATHARFGLGLGRGDDRVSRTVEEAMSSPWFEQDVSRTPVAIAIYSASDPWDKEANTMIDMLRSRMPSTRILWGSYRDPGLSDRIRLSVLLCSKRR